MTHSIPIRSLMTTLPYTVLILTLAGCGPGFEDGSDRAPREPSEIEIRYFEMRAERQERLRTHTGEGPVFTDEELAEFKRMEQDYYAQLEYERIQRQIDKEQSRRREWYAFCEKGHQGNCRDIFKADVEDVDEDERRKTIQTTAYLPNTVVAEYYFGLQGEGCTSDDPVNTWTDVDTVTIQYTGDGDVPRFGDYRLGRWGKRLAECEVNIVLRTPDILVEIPKDVKFEVEVTPGYKEVARACSQEEPYRCGKWLRFGSMFDHDNLHDAHDKIWIVTIVNELPRNLNYEYYFDLAGTGCYTKAKTKEWVNATVQTGMIVKHRDSWVRRKDAADYTEAECEVSAQVRVVGEKPVYIPRLAEPWTKHARLKTPGTVIVWFSVKPE